MNFSRFVESIPKIKDLPLPGQESQYKMAPIERLQELKEIALKQKNPKTAAVMAMFYPDQQAETKLMLILRKTYKGVHSNQVGFPGGKVEPQDQNLVETALRETEEEIGVKATSIRVVKEMTNIYIPPSNFIVQPYLGFVEESPSFSPQDDEVEKLIEVNVLDFLDDSKVITKTLTTSYATDIEVPAFKLNGYVVWGATAMMLSEMKDLLKPVL